MKCRLNPTLVYVIKQLVITIAIMGVGLLTFAILNLIIGYILVHLFGIYMSIPSASIWEYYIATGVASIMFLVFGGGIIGIIIGVVYTIFKKPKILYSWLINCKE